MARKHMMQRWTSSVGVTTRELHRGFLWQRRSHQVCGCWRGMHSRQSNTFHSITAHGLLIIPVVRAQFKHVYQHGSNPGCPASSDVGNTISTKTRLRGSRYGVETPPKMIQSCQRICSYTTLWKIQGFWRTEQSWTLLMCRMKAFCCSRWKRSLSSWREELETSRHLEKGA